MLPLLFKLLQQYTLMQHIQSNHPIEPEGSQSNH
jgi:hypothetical protein